MADNNKLQKCTHNATSRRSRATAVAVEEQEVLHILSVFVALGIQYAIRVRPTVICGLYRSTIFLHIIS